MKYLFCIEDAGANLCGYFPDVPGCVTIGGERRDLVELLRNAAEGLALHFHGESDLPAAAATPDSVYADPEANTAALVAFAYVEPQPSEVRAAA